MVGAATSRRSTPRRPAGHVVISFGCQHSLSIAAIAACIAALLQVALFQVSHQESADGHRRHLSADRCSGPLHRR